jgi:hypothetical protein
MKRAVLIVAVAALCVAGSAVAQDRSGGLIGSGTRADSGQTVGSGGFTMTTQDQVMGSGGFTMTTQDQMMGSGGFTMTAPDQYLGSGGLIGSGTRAADSGQIMGSGGAIGQNGGYLGGGLSVAELPLPDGSSVLVVSSDEVLFVIPIEE